MMVDVAATYTRLAEQEWNRLVYAPYQYLEFQVTMHFLRQYLPKRD